MLALVAVTAFGVIAASNTQASLPVGSALEDRRRSDHAVEVDLALDREDRVFLARSMISPAFAIAEAERATGGGAVAFAAGREEGVLRYVVETIANGRVVVALIDTLVGNVNRTIDCGPVSALLPGPKLAVVELASGDNNGLARAVADGMRNGRFVQAAAPELRDGCATFALRYLSGAGAASRAVLFLPKMQGKT